MNNLVDDYVVFDLETTGFYPDSCKIIEIGALKYKNKKLASEYSVLINPEVNLPEEITNLTGIKEEDLSDKKTIEEVLPEFLGFIEDLPLVAHNASFDISFIEENIKRLNLNPLTNQVIDTLELSRIYIPRAYNHKLETLKKYFHLEYGSHRSVDDCRTTNYVYEYCKNKALVKN